MCGRYTLKSRGSDLQRELHLDHEPVLEARYNIAPTQAAAVVLDSNPRELVLARWGFTPSWARAITEGSKHFNARVESIAEKRMFTAALTHHRCLIPCDGFYEWRHHGKNATPYFLHAPDDGVLTMAGLWTTWRSPDALEIVTFTSITTEADAFMSRLHTRMPAFIQKEHRAAWLSHGTDVKAALSLISPPQLDAFEVSHHVNNAAFDDPRCLEKPTAVQLDLL